MNFKIHKRLMALPLNASERAVTTSISYHVQQDENSSFPSYETIRKESGASNKTISKVIRTLEHAGILGRSHRANIVSGKESNLYTFLFEGIRFNRDNLSKADFSKLGGKLKKLRTLVKNEMLKESKDRKLSPTPSIPSHFKRKDTVTNVTAPKSQSVNNDVRATTGSEGSTIPSQMLPIQSQMLRRSNSDTVPVKTSAPHSSSFPESQNQSQKQLGRKNPITQSTEEWLSAYNQ